MPDHHGTYDRTPMETVRAWGQFLNEHYEDLRMQEMEWRAGA